MRPVKRLELLRISIPILLLGASALAAGCGSEAERPAGAGDRPNVVIISVDTLRADSLGAYGGPIATPEFDRLASEGVLVEIALASAPETAPSHATLLTGETVLRHGVIRNGVELAPEHATVAEVFRAAGYRTAAFVSSFVLDPRFGWDRGFDHYDAHFEETRSTLPKDKAYPGAFWTEHEFGGLDRRGQETTEALREWLEDAPEPFFVFVHYFDPHLPYVPPERFAQQTVRMPVDFTGRSVPGLPRRVLALLIRSYHAEVLYSDDQLRQLVEAVDARAGAGRTLLVVTGDHGEGLGQHQWLEHAVHLYEEQVRVPLLLHWPGGLPAGSRVESPIGLVDVAPTVAALAGVPFAATSDGRSMAEALRAGEEPEPRPILGHRHAFEARAERFPGEKLSVRTESWKYIRASEAPDELFHLVDDEGEQHNLHDERPEVVAELGAILDAHLESTRPAGTPEPIDDETRRKLGALGYVD